MAIKFRPATQANVGIPVTELDDEASKMLDESQKNPEFVKEEPVKEEKEEPKVYLAEAKMAVNLRLDPLITAKIFKVLFPGETVRVCEHNKEWFKLNYKGELCYVLKQYMNVK